MIKTILIIVYYYLVALALWVLFFCCKWEVTVKPNEKFKDWINRVKQKFKNEKVKSN